MRTSAQKSELDVRSARLRSKLDYISERILNDYEVSIATADWKRELWKADEFETKIKLDELEDGEIEAKSKGKRGEPTEEDFAAMDSVDFAAVGEEVRELRERISAMGAVNLVAIEEYAELKERYDFLKAQTDDLWTSKNALIADIDEINSTSQKLFSETFEQIRKNFINNEDVLLNREYMEVRVKTHTKLNISVSTIVDVQNNIFNLHTFMTNCTQKYNISYNFAIEGKRLVITIENKEAKKELIDVNAQPISNYVEVFETDVVAKVIVLTKDGQRHTLYLKNNRTTTEDMLDPDRAQGKTEVIYAENIEDARQQALDIIKGNTYNHNVTFNYYNRELKVGTPITIKTKESIIYDTYISALNRVKGSKMYKYTCGNIRIGFIDKLLKERNKR